MAAELRFLEVLHPTMISLEKIKLSLVTYDVRVKLSRKKSVKAVVECHAE